jgi:BirA family transcriptional regulator, biotin operon repressor / biotin---[acetyl-CoA-carboxylase] ligase
MQLINENYLKEQFEKLQQDMDVIVFESIDSTSTFLKKITPKQKPIICLSEQQTQGRGRFNRPWHSPFGENIYLSLLVPIRKKLHQLSGLSLVVGLSMLHALKSYMQNHHLYIKWPNDIFYEDKKLAGNLIEVHSENAQACYLIIGVGINVNMRATEV